MSCYRPVSWYGVKFQIEQTPSVGRQDPSTFTSHKQLLPSHSDPQPNISRGRNPWVGSGVRTHWPPSGLCPATARSKSGIRTWGRRVWRAWRLGPNNGTLFFFCRFELHCTACLLRCPPSKADLDVDLPTCPPAGPQYQGTSLRLSLLTDKSLPLYHYSGRLLVARSWTYRIAQTYHNSTKHCTCHPVSIIAWNPPWLYSMPPRPKVP